MGQLFQELKRRNVIRVAIAYAVSAWLLIEVTATIFPILSLPKWTVTLVTVCLFIGLPIALIFAWAFELTPEGIKREKEVDRSQSITLQAGKRLDRMIIVVLTLALGYFAGPPGPRPPMWPMPYWTAPIASCCPENPPWANIRWMQPPC